MDSIIKYLVKTFLFFFILFGVLSFLINFSAGFRFDSITLSFVWSLIMTLFFGGYHIYEIQQNGDSMTDASLNTRQYKTVRSSINKTDLMFILLNESKYSSLDIKEEDNIIKFQTKLSFKSWGERVSIVSKNISENLFEYKISSKPKVPTTFIDYGKNLENVQAIERILRR